MKPILPSLKHKKRYVVYEIITNAEFDDSRLVEASIKQEFTNLFGEFGAGEASLIFVPNSFDKKLQRGIVKVNHTSVDRLRVAFLMTQKVGRKKAIIRSVGTSGILKKAKNKFIAS